jgi:hypothetical protein
MTTWFSLHLIQAIQMTEYHCSGLNILITTVNDINEVHGPYYLHGGKLA